MRASYVSRDGGVFIPTEIMFNHLVRRISEIQYGLVVEPYHFLVLPHLSSNHLLICLILANALEEQR